MIASPNHVLVRVVLTALALVGFLAVLALELMILGAGTGESVVAAVRCLIAPVSSLDTAVHASAVAIGALAALPILLGAQAASRARARVGELRHAATTAQLSTLPPRVVAAATRTRVRDCINVVEAPRAFAFAYGWIWPRICVSTGLVDLLDDAELDAVLHHEGWHVARRDPLRLLLVQTVGAAFAIVPEIRRLVRLYVLAMEVAADRHVVAVMGHPRSLASALAKTAAPPVAPPAFEGLAGARAAALAGSFPMGPRWRGRVAAAVLLVELLVLIPLLTNGSIVALAGFWIHPVC